MLGRVRGFAGPGHDLVGLLPRLGEASAVLHQQFVGLFALPFGGVDRLRDRFRAFVQGLLDPWEGDLAEHPHREQEDDQRPDHQPDTGRDQEATFARRDRNRGYLADKRHR